MKSAKISDKQHRRLKLIQLATKESTYPEILNRLINEEFEKRKERIHELIMADGIPSFGRK